MTEKIFHKILENKIKENKSRLLFQKKDGWSWKQITWLDYDSEVRSIASYLIDIGFTAGDEVLIISPNHLDCIFVESAVLMIGGVCIPVSENETMENIESILKENEKLRFVFSSNKDVVESLQGMQDSYRGINRIFTFYNAEFDPDSNVVSYKNVLKFGFLKRKKLNDTINDMAESISPGDTSIKMYNFRDRKSSKIITHERLIKLMDLVNKKIRFMTGEDQSFSLLGNSDSFSKLASFLPLYIGNRGAMATYQQDFFKDIKEIMPTVLFMNHESLQEIQKQVSSNGKGGEELKKSFGGRVRYVFTDYIPGFAVKSNFIDSGISIIELNELVMADS